jgi:hypothetical protein
VCKAFETKQGGSFSCRPQRTHQRILTPCRQHFTFRSFSSSLQVCDNFLVPFAKLFFRATPTERRHHGPLKQFFFGKLRLTNWKGTLWIIFEIALCLSCATHHCWKKTDKRQYLVETSGKRDEGTLADDSKSEWETKTALSTSTYVSKNKISKIINANKILICRKIICPGHTSVHKRKKQNHNISLRGLPWTWGWNPTNSSFIFIHMVNV